MWRGGSWESKRRERERERERDRDRDRERESGKADVEGCVVEE